MLRRPPDPHESINDRLINACKRGTTSTIKAMLGKGANANQLCIEAFTLLHWAARKNKANVCAALIEGGTDIENNMVTLQGHWLQTPLLSACEQRSTESAIELIVRGANVNATNKNSKTALMMAVAEGLTEVVRELLSRGADVDAIDSDGFTALHWSVFASQPALCVALLNTGADRSIVDKLDQTAGQIAKNVSSSNHGVFDVMQSWEVHHAAKMAMAELSTSPPSNIHPKHPRPCQ